jgi:predicted AAA+ superfamily ATPase
MVTGPRQVGKTTMLEKLSEAGRTHVSLDLPFNRELTRTDPELFLQRYQPPVLIDEFQYAPELLVYIKAHVDKSRVPGSFWLTGSQMFHMMQQVGESLAGRIPLYRCRVFRTAKLRDCPLATCPRHPMNGWTGLKHTKRWDWLMSTNASLKDQCQ